MTQEPRGMALNNCGNIRIGLPHFQGEFVPSKDPQFRQFQTMEYGIRAIGKILLTYQQEHNLRTIRQIINRWAPPADDNPTDAYIDNVATRSGFEPDAVLDMRVADDMDGIITGIIDQEQGGMWSIRPEDIADAVRLALA